MSRAILTKKILNENVSILPSGEVRLKNTVLCNTIKKKIKYSLEMLSDLYESEDVAAEVLLSITNSLDELRVKELKDISENGENSEYFKEFMFMAMYDCKNRMFTHTPYVNYTKDKVSLEKDKHNFEQIKLDAILSDEDYNASNEIPDTSNIPSNNIYRDVIEVTEQAISENQKGLLNGTFEPAYRQGKCIMKKNINNKINNEFKNIFDDKNPSFRLIHCYKTILAIDRIIEASIEQQMIDSIINELDNVDIFDLFYSSLSTKEVKEFLSKDVSDKLLKKFLCKLYKFRSQLVEKYDFDIRYSIEAINISNGYRCVFENEEKVILYFNLDRNKQAMKLRSILRKDSDDVSLNGYTFNWIE